MTAQELIKAALRNIGVLSTGQTPSDETMADALESLQILIRTLSARKINIHSISSDDVTLDGSTSYTIGEDGTPDVNTVRPNSIRGGYVRDSNNFDHPVRIIDDRKYRRLRLKNISGTVEYVYYNPTYPNGTLYVFPTGGDTLTIESLKPLTAPTGLTTTVSFPPEYDALLKFNLAVHMAPEYGRQVSQETAMIAADTIAAVQSVNFSNQVVAVTVDPIRFTGRYNIDEG